MFSLFFWSTYKTTKLIILLLSVVSASNPCSCYNWWKSKFGWIYSTRYSSFCKLPAYCWIRVNSQHPSPTPPVESAFRFKPLFCLAEALPLNRNFKFFSIRQVLFRGTVFFKSCHRRQMDLARLMATWGLALSNDRKMDFGNSTFLFGFIFVL